MGKATISVAIFNSYVSHYQRVDMMKPSHNGHDYGGIMIKLTWWSECNVENRQPIRLVERDLLRRMVMRSSSYQGRELNMKRRWSKLSASNLNLFPHILLEIHNTIEKTIFECHVSFFHLSKHAASNGESFKYIHDCMDMILLCCLF